MVNLIIYVIAFLITFPFFTTWITYMIARGITGHKLKSFHISLRWTTIFYIISVLLLNNIYFDRMFIGSIGIVLLIVLSAVIIYQRKVNIDIQFGRALKFLWRFCFLFFSIVYLSIFIYSVIFIVSQ